MGATRLKNVAGHKRGQATDQELEAPPKKHRDKPSSRTNLAGCGSETGVGCGHLIPPTVDVNPKTMGAIVASS